MRPLAAAHNADRDVQTAVAGRVAVVNVYAVSAVVIEQPPGPPQFGF
jgi:hypothetical protein